MISIVVVLFGCAGSQDYRGDWKATNRAGERFDISFSEHDFQVTNESGEVNNHEYSQYSFKHSDGVSTYGIKLEDGRAFNVFFPLKQDSTKAVIELESKEVIYTLCRDRFLLYEELFAL